MNSSDGVSLTTASQTSTSVSGAPKTTLLTLHTQKTSIIEAATMPTPTVDSAVIAVVIAVIVLTLLVVAFLLYRYQCHNKGAYRTTGELAPGEDPDEGDAAQDTSGKKEYFI